MTTVECNGPVLSHPGAINGTYMKYSTTVLVSVGQLPRLINPESSVICIAVLYTTVLGPVPMLHTSLTTVTHSQTSWSYTRTAKQMLPMSLTSARLLYGGPHFVSAAVTPLPMSRSWSYTARQMPSIS